jgi:hypothetical protein
MHKTCNSCNTNDMAVMPIAQHEKDQNRLMGIIKWLIAVIVILIVLFVGSNTFWIWRESQYEDVVTTEETIIDAQQDGEGTNIVGGGDVNYGAEG